MKLLFVFLLMICGSITQAQGIDPVEIFKKEEAEKEMKRQKEEAEARELSKRNRLMFESNYRVIDSNRIERYCTVLASGKFMSTKVTISVDFGEEISFWSGKDLRLKDTEGKVKNFNSVIDALNYMASEGWVLHSTMLLGSGPYVYHYIMKKEYVRKE